MKERGEQLTGLSKANLDKLRGIRTIREFTNIKQLAKTAVVGVAVGATAGAGLGVIGAIAGATASASTGVALGILGTGYAGVEAVKTGTQLASAYKKGEIGKTELFANIGGVAGNVVVGVASGYAGVKLGSLAVNYATGSLTAKETAILKQLEANKRINFKVEQGRGVIKEVDLKGLKLDPTKQAELIKQVQKGNIVREFKLDINKAGLSSKEIAVLNKLNPKIKLYQVINQVSVGKVTTGRMGLGSKERLYGDAYGVGKDGNIIGKYRNIRFDGGAKNIKEVDMGVFKSTGKVKYSADKLSRIERSKTDITSLIRLQFKKGKWVQSDIAPKETYSNSLFKSKYERTETYSNSLFKSKYERTDWNVKANEEGLAMFKKTDVYRDVSGKVISGTKGQPKSLKGSLEITPIPKTAKTTLFESPTTSAPKVNPPKVDASQPTTSSTTKTEFPSITQAGGKGESSYGNAQSMFAYKERGIFLEQPLVNPPTLNAPSSTLMQSVRASILGQITPATTIKTAVIYPQIQAQAGIKEKLKYAYDSLKPELRHIGLIKAGLIQGKTEGLFATQVYSPQIALAQRIDIRQDSLLKPVQTPLLKQPLLKQPLIQPQYADTILNYGFGLPFAPILGNVEVGGGQRTARERTGLFGKAKYNPSLGSVLTKTKAKKVTEKEFIALTNKKYKGLGLRPIIKVIKN
jgi:hypothetical protein